MCSCCESRWQSDCSAPRSICLNDTIRQCEAWSIIVDCEQNICRQWVTITQLQSTSVIAGNRTCNDERFSSNRICCYWVYDHYGCWTDCYRRKIPLGRKQIETAIVKYWNCNQTKWLVEWDSIGEISPSLSIGRVRWQPCRIKFHIDCISS